MATRIREYYRPAEWPEALAALSRPAAQARPLVLGPRPEPLDQWQAEVVVDLSRLNLSYVAQDGETLRLGGLTPLQTIVESAHVRAVADGILSTAAELAGGRAMRQTAALAGALRPGAGPPEVALALLALDATLVARGPADREVSLAGWLPQAGEVVVEVRLSTAGGAAGSLQRVARTPRDQAIVAAAAVLSFESGVCRSARIALAGAHPEPGRLQDVEALLAGHGLTPQLLDQAAQAAQRGAQPQADYRGGLAYRASLAGTLVRRAVAEAWDHARR